MSFSNIVRHALREGHGETVKRVAIIVDTTSGLLRIDAKEIGFKTLQTVLSSGRAPLAPHMKFDVSLHQWDPTRGRKLTDLGLRAFDVVMLFGYEPGEPPEGRMQAWKELAEDELEAVRSFMNSGGGLLAVGDHGQLGANLCASIPRVRSMRNWIERPTAGVDLLHYWNVPPFGSGGDEAADCRAGNDLARKTKLANDLKLIPRPEDVEDEKAKAQFEAQRKALELEFGLAESRRASRRHDTNRPATESQQRGTDEIPNRAEADGVGQVAWGATWSHPLLTGIELGGKAVVLPDHPHEGRTNQGNIALYLQTHFHLESEDSVWDDYPGIAAGEYRGGPRPRIAIYAETASRWPITGPNVVDAPAHGVELRHLKGPVGQFVNRSLRGGGSDYYRGWVYGLATTYDGTPKGVGRVVVDSTWHHWAHLNVADLDSTAQRSSYGYWLNVAAWLCGESEIALATGMLISHDRSYPGMRLSHVDNSSAALQYLKESSVVGVARGALADEVLQRVLGQEAFWNFDFWASLGDDLEEQDDDYADFFDGVIDERRTMSRALRSDIRVAASAISQAAVTGLAEAVAELEREDRWRELEDVEELEGVELPDWLVEALREKVTKQLEAMQEGADELGIREAVDLLLGDPR